VEEQNGVTRIVRAASNQALFRAVNERLEDLAHAFEDVAGPGTAFACECADLHCIDQISMSVDEYEAVRRNPNNFVVLPGHVYPEVEEVVSENDRYVVVAKIGEGAEIAVALDPRGEAASQEDGSA
jgi:hypothetical protein